MCVFFKLIPHHSLTVYEYVPASQTCFG